MQANPVQAIQYFDGTKQSIIPLFQRPYTWEQKNWRTLWNDILIQYDNPAFGHFMGAIVSIPVQTVPVGVSKHLIIDGQQRLTTLAIILCAIREKSDTKASAKIDDYLINRHYDDADRLKLLPTNIDRETYHQLITRESPNNPHHPIVSAYNFFRKAMDGTDLDGDKIDVTRLLQTMEQSLRVVMINLSDTDDPYLIFESLNYKGEPLTQADLIRNYILMRFKHSVEPGGDQERIHNKLWKPIEDGLGDYLMEFLRHFAMRYGENLRQGGIYAAMKSWLSSQQDSTDVEESIKEMRVFSKYYEKLIDTRKEDSHLIRSMVLAINELEVRTSYPLLLRLYDMYSTNVIQISEFVSCLKTIESYIVRRAICGVPTNSLNRYFLQLCKGLPNAEVAAYLKSSMASGNGVSRWPRDEELLEAMRTQSQYSRKSTRYVLKRIEQSYRHKEPVSLEELTIEHVMPQTLTLEWVKMLGERYEQIHTTLLHTIGNLTLTGYNGELSNLPFKEKRSILRESHLEVNRWISEQIKWSDNEIKIRTNELAMIAKSLWPGPEA